MNAATALMTPRIVCPAWCTVPSEEHAADLTNWDGHCVHSSPALDLPARVYAYLGEWSWFDGTPDADEVTGAGPYLMVNGDPLTLEQGEELARAILALVAQARA